LPSAESPADEPGQKTVADSEPDPGSVVHADVQLPIAEEIDRVRAMIEEGQPWAAVMILQDVRAMAEISGTRLDASMIQQLRRRAEVDALRGPMIRCWSCEGTGKARMLLFGLNGRKDIREVANQRCKICGGIGELSTRMTADAASLASSRAARWHRDFRRSLGWVQREGFWLPPDTEASIADEALQQARTTVPVLCPKCSGIGALGCEVCRGRGKLACTATDCIAGQVPCPTCKGMKKVEVEDHSRTLTRPCPDCRQTGVAQCEVCRGRGYLDCEECDGRGDELCGRCKGLGELPPSRKLRR